MTKSMPGLAIVSSACWLLGLLPLLALIFFSPGLDAEGPAAYALMVFAVLTLIGLLITAMRYPLLLIMVLVQIGLIAMVLYQTFSDAALYLGT